MREITIIGLIAAAIIAAAFALVWGLVFLENNIKFSHQNYNAWMSIHPELVLKYEDWRSLGESELLPGQATTKTEVIPIPQPVYIPSR